MDKEALTYAAINTGIALLIIGGICLLIRLCITHIRLLIPVFILGLFTGFYIEYKND